MSRFLFVIEAPGKRQGLFAVLAWLGIRDVDVVATGGYLADNPNGFKVLGLDRQYRETSYHLRSDRKAIASVLKSSIRRAETVFLAMDDDAEGDVIARDVVKFCSGNDALHKFQRVRLRSMEMAAVRSAIESAMPFDAALAVKGDSRRIFDRALGSLSAVAGAPVGRVTSAVLLSMAAHPPVIGEVVHRMDTPVGPFFSRELFRAGGAVPEPLHVHALAGVGDRCKTALGGQILHHDDLVWMAGLRVGLGLSVVAGGLQRLYECGKASYPRTRSRFLQPEQVVRLSEMAHRQGLPFNADLLAGRVKPADGPHDAIHPLVDAELHADIRSLPDDQKLLVFLSQQLLQNAHPAWRETPDLRGVSASVSARKWQRIVVDGAFPSWWNEPETGVFHYGAEQSVLRHMVAHGFGSPSTSYGVASAIVGHGLVDQVLEFTKKGMASVCAAKSIIVEEKFAKKVDVLLESHMDSSGVDMASVMQDLNLDGLFAQVLMSAAEVKKNDNESSSEMESGLFY
jgi:DNA topoisomerase I